MLKIILFKESTIISGYHCIKNDNSRARSAHGDLLWTVVVRCRPSCVVRQHLMFTL